MSAATVATPPQVVTDERVILPHVSWETYERLLADDEERRIPRMIYDQGVLELVTPSLPHEEYADTLADIVKLVAAALGIRMRRTGATTYRRKDLQRGFESDASFYIQNEERIRGKREIDFTIDPPPDLVLEMEMSRSIRDKQPLFASMGVPELWRCDGRRITILVLEDEVYHVESASRALPILTSNDLERFLANSRTTPSPEWFEFISAWARGQREPSS